MDSSSLSPILTSQPRTSTSTQLLLVLPPAGSCYYPALRPRAAGQACAADQCAVSVTVSALTVEPATVFVLPVAITQPAAVDFPVTKPTIQHISVPITQHVQAAAQATGSVTDVPSTYQLKWNKIENLQPITPQSGPAAGQHFMTSTALHCQFLTRYSMVTYGNSCLTIQTTMPIG